MDKGIGIKNKRALATDAAVIAVVMVERLLNAWLGLLLTSSINLE